MNYWLSCLNYSYKLFYKINNCTHEDFIPFTYVFLFHFINRSTYGDYVGGGHDQNITVTTSSDFQPPGFEEVAEGSNTLAVRGLTGKLIDAGRFLAQATMGADRMTIDSVAKLDFEDWIDQQFASPPSYIRPLLQEIYDTTFNVI